MIALLYIAIALIGAALGIGILMAVQKSTGRSRAKTIVEDAQREAEVIMKDKLLEAREQELRIKTEAEKAANQRLSRVQSEEAKLKQRQSQLNQQQSENTKARNEIEQSRREIEAQSQALEVRGEELDRLRRSAQEALEHISGLSSEEAKEKLVESLKDEAKTAAAAYIHDIMDEAKIKSIPAIDAQDLDAQLIHEAAIGRIAGDQILKLMTLGLTEEEAEEKILEGFLN